MEKRMGPRNYTEHEGFQNDDADRAVLIDAQNRQRTASLFLETTDTPDRYPPLYSLRDMDNHGLPSAYLIYINSIDEYDAAMKLVGSMRHWRKLLNCTWFMQGNPKKGFEGLEQWRQDLLDRDASAGKRALMLQSKKGDTSAARKLVDMAKPAAAPKVGRPGTKADKAEKERDAAAKARLERVAEAKRRQAEKKAADAA